MSEQENPYEIIKIIINKFSIFHTNIANIVAKHRRAGAFTEQELLQTAVGAG